MVIWNVKGMKDNDKMIDVLTWMKKEKRNLVILLRHTLILIILGGSPNETLRVPRVNSFVLGGLCRDPPGPPRQFLLSSGGLLKRPSGSLRDFVLSSGGLLTRPS